jgi:molybdate transport system regulatory protein
MTMEPQLKINVLEDDHFVFGDAEMRLLDAIARQGTLSEGAAALGLSYRAAWGKLRAAEASLGTKLVETTVGGSGGGSSRLTETAERLVGRYNRFRAAVGAFTLAEFARCFGEDADCNKLVLSRDEGLRLIPGERSVDCADDALSLASDAGLTRNAEPPILTGEQL